MANGKRKIAKVERELTNGGSDRKGREIHRDRSQRIAKQGTEVVNEWCCERKGGGNLMKMMKRVRDHLRKHSELGWQKE